MKFDACKQMCAVFLLCAANAIVAPAQTFTTLHSFTGTDGANPYAGLAQGTDGNFYGTTIDGGTSSSGNVIKVTPGGTVTTLYNFCSQSNCTDGQYPVSTLVLGNDGNFYGTTQNGGIYNLLYGTIFKITPSGTLTTLHSFDASDGVSPYGSLLLASDGNFYGTATEGGACVFATGGCGTIFSITPNGIFTTLYNFCLQNACPDGQYPGGGLIEGSDGNIYGTTRGGGSYASCSVSGCGTVFKITTSGVLTTMHVFNKTDGDFPNARLVEGPKGVFYGTTAGGGATDNGTVFTITSSGTLTTIHSFDDTDGGSPYVLTPGSDGSFYGGTLGGGANNNGTIFKITPGGTLTTLHNFTGMSNYFLGQLTQGTNGTFYGTTYFGGSASDGSIYTLSTGLKSFVSVQPGTGKVGASVRILGTNLSAATGVSFNGTSAAFHTVSKTLITATVPSGATSGRVQVMGSNHTLLSNVPFLVTP
jgi:uncharacterized repeat protein (TIGR03803 family)